MINDLRLAIRLLGKAPGYTAAAIATLALAIGANAAVFSAVYAVLLKPAAIRDPGRLVVLWGSDAPHALPLVELTYRAVEAMGRDVRSFTRVGGMGSSTWPAWLNGRGARTRVPLAGVSGTFFETLGVVPALGRTLRPDDDVPNGPAVVVLSHALWISRFGADPSVIGTRIDLDRPFTVVGVMPPGFDVPDGAALWTPVAPLLAAAGPDVLDTVAVLYAVGRLAPGVTPAAARDELNRFVDGWIVAHGGQARSGYSIVVTPFVEFAVGPARQALWALLAAVALLLLISCANVSGLMLTRVSLRRREHAIRLALGARAAELARSWIVETMVLAGIGGALGVVGARWIVKALVALAPDGVPRLDEAAINGPVAIFSFGAIVTTALLCGIGPVRGAAAPDPVRDLNDAARATSTPQTRRVRSGLVVLQIALSVVLLVAATLVLRSFVELRAVDLGFVPRGALTMNVMPSNAKRPVAEWMEDLLRRLRTIPHVEAVGAVSLRPLGVGAIGNETWVLLDGQPDTDTAAEKNPALNYEVASPGYFEAMRIPLKRGRLFTAQDDRRSRQVSIVSETTARRLWPGADPIGQRLMLPSIGNGPRAHEWRTVIGVVGDVHYRGLDDVRLDVYDAARQAPLDALTIVVRGEDQTVGLAAAMQTEARRFDPGIFIDGVTTMDAAVGRVMAPWRFSAWTFGAFAAFAFALAIVGLSGLVLLEVSGRRRELAIRSAIGARRAHLLGAVLVPAGRRAVAGGALGLAASIAVHRALRSLLFGVDAADVWTYAGVVAAVIATVAVASYLPARKAAAVDPATLFTTE